MRKAAHAIALVALAATACQVAPADRAVDATLLAAIDAWAGAFVAGDIKAMLACYEDAATLVVQHSFGERQRTLTELRAHYEQAFREVVFRSASLAADVVQQHGDVAWVHGNFVATTETRADHATWRLEIRTTQVWRRTGGCWRIALEQSTPIAGVPRLTPGEPARSR